MCRPPGIGATARELPAHKPSNGPFRPTSAALSSTRCSTTELQDSWTSSSKSKDDFKFKDAATSSSRTRSPRPRPDPLPQQGFGLHPGILLPQQGFGLHPGILSEPKDEIAAIVEEGVRSLKAFSDELLHDFRHRMGRDRASRLPARGGQDRASGGHRGKPATQAACAHMDLELM